MCNHLNHNVVSQKKKTSSDEIHSILLLVFFLQKTSRRNIPHHRSYSGLKIMNNSPSILVISFFCNLVFENYIFYSPSSSPMSCTGIEDFTAGFYKMEHTYIHNIL